MVSADGRPVVLDNGSLNIKAGYAGESAPRILVPTLLTRTFTARGHSDWYVGENAKVWLKHMPVACPISHGQVTDLDELAIIWHYLYSKELRVNAVDHPLMLSEYPLIPINQREGVVELVFEKFCIPSLFCSNQAALSLYSNGMVTGLTVDIGNDTINVAPVQDNQVIRSNSKQLFFGGRDITHYLQNLLISSNPSAVKFITTEIAKYFKENLCYVTHQPVEHTDVKTITFQTPDAQLVRIGRERVAAPEILFNPQKAGLECEGLPQIIHTIIKNCTPELQQWMYENVVLSGGGTLLAGLDGRLDQELRTFAPKPSSVRIIAPDKRKYSVWIGGSILASLNSFREFAVTKQEYEEKGRQIVSQLFP